MSIIREHKVTLQKEYPEYTIVLRPTYDFDIPLLMELNSDPRAIYWSSGETEPYDEETVKAIWGMVSQNAYCFIIEVDNVPVGDCWLQKMNLPDVQKLYDSALDVRRIDMSIGRVDYWGKGIGTRLVSMLTQLAFEKEGVDVMHCICNDDNIRSNRVWQKLGYQIAVQTPREEGGFENHYRLTKKEYFSPIQFAVSADVETINSIMQYTAQNIPNRDWFYDDDLDFIRRHINSESGYTLKYMVEGEIAGFLIIRYPGSDDDNLGRYLDLPAEELQYVAHMESTCVLPQYRGRRIFQQLTARALEIERAKGRTRYFMGTAHPDNQYSMNIFLQSGFSIYKTVRKYDNWLRNVMLLEM